MNRSRGSAHLYSSQSLPRAAPGRRPRYAVHAARPTRGRRRSSRLPALLAFAAVLGALFLLAATAASFVVYRSYVSHFIPPDRLAINQPSLGARIYDRNGTLLYEYVDDRQGLRDPVKLDAVAAPFLAATIATEDRTFFSNPGVSVRGLARAALENLNPFGDSFLDGPGGSSITQQLVKNVYIPAGQRSSRSLDRKLKETTYAIELTRRYSKDQILEWYVNQISYGSVYNGVEAASEGYFGKPASELTLAEAALLAGIPQSPAAYDPRQNPEQALARRNQVLDLMREAGRIQIGSDSYVEYGKDEIDAAKAEPLAVAPPRFPIEAPHFVLTYVQPQLERIFGKEAVYTMGLKVYTTLDLGLQHQAQDVLEKWIEQFERTSNSRNGAIIVIDPNSGEIRVMIGSRDYFRDDIDGTVNNVLAMNSPGSSFKPFVYLTAFLKFNWGPGTIIQDVPTTYREANGAIFQPQNPVPGSYQGNITIRNALGNSLNVPAFRTALAIGVADIVTAARHYGFTTLQGYYGPAIAIGGVDLTELDLAYAYSMLAAGGRLTGMPVEPRHPGERDLDPIAITKVEDSKGNVVFDIKDHRKTEQVVPEEYAYLITSILSDPNAECLTFGCGGLTVPGYQVAVKTGTSSPYDPAGPNAGKIGDTWAFGYTRDYVVGVWAGNSDNSPVTNILSTSISFRAMRDTMLAAYGGRRQTPWQQPANVERRSSCAGAATPGLGPAACSEDLAVRVPVPYPFGGASAGVKATPAPPPASAATGGGASVSIASPAGGDVSGVVQILGSANVAGMQFYRLEFGSGVSPQSWSTIGQWSLPVSAGALGAWNTTPLQPGLYTLRLTVQDRSRGLLVSSVTVNVVH